MHFGMGPLFACMIHLCCRSNAFKNYVEQDKLEAGAFIEAHNRDSSDDEEWGLDDWPVEAMTSCI